MTPTLGLAGLVASYVLIAALLLGISVRSGWPWKVKAAIIIVTTGFYLVTYFSYPQILGWPTADQPPRRFRLLAAFVEKPDGQRHSNGAIYLWLAPINDLASALVPRAYRFPYSVTLHERVLNASSKLDQGIAQLGEFAPADGGVNVSGKYISGSGEKSANMVFYDLPDTLFPER